MKAFEIHTFQSGKWKIDSVFDDRDLALFEARRMDASGRFSGVRVIEEIFMPQSMETKSRTIFRGTKVESHNQTDLQKSREVRQYATQGRARHQQANVRRKEQARRRRNRRKADPVRLFFITLVIIALAGGALYWIHASRYTF